MSKGLNQLIDRAKKDRAFFWELLSNPAEATSQFELTDKERAAIGGNTIQVLGGLADAGVLVNAGCGSSPTCDSTCTATCTVTFTSVQSPGELVART
jgi:hypothetical protein